MIHWTQSTSSGLCDRLIDVLYMSTMARFHGTRFRMEWHDYKLTPLDVPHRAIDIQLENVLKHMSLPPECQFEGRCDRVFDQYLGARHTPEAFWREYMAHVCNFPQFHFLMKKVGEDFTFNGPIHEFVRCMPEHFSTLHIRRGDKVRDEPSDGCFIHVSELENLEVLTLKAVDYLLSNYGPNIFVCGDIDVNTHPVVPYIQSQGRVFLSGGQNFPLERHEQTFYDLAAMTLSRLNVTANRHSSFSKFPTLIRNNGSQYCSVFDLGL